MIKYEMQEANPDTLTQAMIIRTNEDGSKSFIPIDEANSDYQAYLNPVEHLTEIVPDEPAAKSK